MRLDALDYDLPEELIAQRPLPERDGARLLVLTGRARAHHLVRELPALLPPSLWVVNDTRVIRARLTGKKPTGGRVELLLVTRLGPGADRWLALGRASKGLGPGTTVSLADDFSATVEARRGNGSVEVRLQGDSDVMQLIERHGAVPLPPYIRRAPDPADAERYQTIFAARAGAVAAPTAGLHLSERLLEALEGRGHRITSVTLHVGPGTFQPVKAAHLGDHAMHEEHYHIGREAAEAVTQARAQGRPVVAVGTTVVRTLESAANPDGTVRGGAGSTNLLIYPPYEFRVVDTLLTNFHLPRSTLLALVMAFGGVDAIRSAYAEAVRARYRFFSYGDAMLLRRQNS